MATAFKIDKDVPVPKTGKYPFREMEVGDSFVAPLAKRSSISCVMGRYAPKKFTTSKISDTECRVWRIA